MEQVDFEQLGAKLKEAREKKNISLEEISTKTKINIEFLKKFEQGIFDFLPEFYVRHFLKSYLMRLGESFLPYLDEFEKLNKEAAIHEKETDPPKEKSAFSLQQVLRSLHGLRFKE